MQKFRSNFRVDILVEVILALAFDGQTFTYRCNHKVDVGARVLVPFINKKVVGVVVSIHNEMPLYKIKDVEQVIDQTPIMSPSQIDMMRWISHYYMCPVGEIFRQIMPKGIRSADYTPPTRVGIRLKNNDLEQVEALLKKRKAGMRALTVLLSFGEDAQVGKRELIENGATEIGIKSLIEFDIVEIVSLPIHVYKSLTNGVSWEGESLKPRIFIGNRIEQSIDLIRQAMKNAGRTNGMCIVFCPNNFWAKRVAELLNDDSVVEYHAKLSENKRSENYLRVLNAQESVGVVVGTKLALLLPYFHVSEIIVLDEASHSYKSDRSPKLNVRDCAIIMANKQLANITLTSLVPSMESFANSKFGRMDLIDNRKEQAKVMILEKGKGQLFSRYMLNRIEEVIGAGGQVIVFQNRRGFAGSIVCNKCGYTPTCPHCNVTLTYHQSANNLMCHHCDYAIKASSRCKGCNSEELTLQGIGTERVEEQLAYHFPDARIARVDSDTVARSDAFGEIKEDIESANCDIIVATQLILSGLRVPRAMLCVVVNADNMFLSTDFRTSERIISTLTQLRAMVSQEIIIQATNSQNPLLKILEGDYLEFFETELSERTSHNYPPFSRLVTIRLSHENPRLLERAAIDLEQVLLPIFGSRLTSPYEPIGDRRLQSKFVLELMLKLKRDANLGENKSKLDAALKTFAKRNTSIAISADVDPL